MSEFLKQVDQRVPRLDPEGSHEFVETHSVAQTARVIAATDANPGLVHAFIALLEMTVAASRTAAVAEIRQGPQNSSCAPRPGVMETQTRPGISGLIAYHIPGLSCV
jgi:hypothetical protein